MKVVDRRRRPAWWVEPDKGDGRASRWNAQQNTMFDQDGSRRWMHFQSALQLAIQRSARKWTFEDFAECFPLYVEEEKNAATDDIKTLFEKYGVRENIDVLHKIVTEAKARKERGEITKDIAREDLPPKNALERENEQLQAKLDENVQAKDEADLKSLELLQILEETYAEWEKLPSDPIEDWTVQTANALKSSMPQ
ncbi:hypothetical protein NP233_g3430 [Leucocoprinus birnbaumii]|uniref:Uncharacterized protein n=1 Tax=Leucocoprinus birnbaumii TaxID=56174 RepID=A0AAD5YXZ1_9AGAR|nr:hypothetical protein NP233_g3430 [Leucocoprinus birnbaumii]